MKKQAFLIIAHNNFLVLEKLISILESPRVDIYLHLDAKVKEIPLFLKDTDVKVLNDRIDTRWGDLSQIETEYLLFEEAFKKGTYSHYHIISGTHFPLTDIDAIVKAFDEWEGNTVFHWFCQAAKQQETLKLRRYNYLTRYLSYGPNYSKRLCQFVRRFFLILQDKMNIVRNKDISFYKASNWAAFSEEAVDYLLTHKDDAMKIFKYSFCGDEFFAPTLLMNSPLKDKIVRYNKYLFIEMGEANPRELTMADYGMIMSCGCMFARKFGDNNIDVVDKIMEHIKLCH